MPLALFHAIHYKEDAMPCVGLIGARTFRFIASALAGAVLVFSGASAADAASSFRQNPIVFVHGIEGSGAQFESQKMRFMSNGYPERWIDEVDYNSTRAVADKSEVDQQIDAAIAALEQRTGKSQVDVVAHSLGTSVMYDYLTNGAMAAQRRANVAHYINVDGQNQDPGLPTLHIYYEPFVRSDFTLRLLQSVAIEQYVGDRPDSMAGVEIRYKELWGDQGAESDQLLINGLNVCTSVLCPISKQVNAFFAFDRNRDGQTDLSSPDPVLSALPFIQGADVFIPASSPPGGTASFQLVSRGGGPVRTLDVPNWDSTTDGAILQWRDFESLT